MVPFSRWECSDEKDVSSLTLEEWFPPQGGSASQGTLSDVRGHLGLSRLEVG